MAIGANIHLHFHHKMLQYLWKVSGMIIHIRSLDQWCGVMHEWMHISDASLKRILIIWVQIPAGSYQGYSKWYLLPPCQVFCIYFKNGAGKLTLRATRALLHKTFCRSFLMAKIRKLQQKKIHCNLHRDLPQFFYGQKNCGKKFYATGPRCHSWDIVRLCLIKISDTLISY